MRIYFYESRAGKPLSQKFEKSTRSLGGAENPLSTDGTAINLLDGPKHKTRAENSAVGARTFLLSRPVWIDLIRVPTCRTSVLSAVRSVVIAG